MTQSPAGWYPDPTPASQQPTLRYWDGQAWTEHVAPGAAAHGTRAIATTPDGEPLAGWWLRVLAVLIDTVILSIAGGILTFPVQIGLQKDLNRLNEQFTREIEANPAAMPDVGQYFDSIMAAYQGRAWALFIPGLLLFLIYVPGLLRWKGATLGKLACGLRVRLRDEPGQLPWSTIAVRITVQYLIVQALVIVAFTSGSWIIAALCMTIWTIFSFLDPLWATWDSKKQAIHDKVARTNVVRTR